MRKIFLITLLLSLLPLSTVSANSQDILAPDIAAAARANGITTEDEAFLRDMVARGDAVRRGPREIIFAGSDGTFGATHVSDGEPVTDDIGLVVLATLSDCPYGWACLYDYGDFTGRMLKFQEVTSTWQSLAAYDFANRASSYYNRRNHLTYLKDQATLIKLHMKMQEAARIQEAYNNIMGLLWNTHDYTNRFPR